VAERRRLGRSGPAAKGTAIPAIPARRVGGEDTRSDMTRAADAVGWKPYLRADDSEPAAVTAARERWRAIEAEFAARRAAREAAIDALIARGGDDA